MRTILYLDFDDEEFNYLDSSARIRGTSRNALIHRVLKVVLSDQLILGILDDEDEYRARQDRTRRRVVIGAPTRARSKERA